MRRPICEEREVVFPISIELEGEGEVVLQNFVCKHNMITIIFISLN